MIEAAPAAAVLRPPRSVAWTLVVASALAVLVTGVLATLVVLTEHAADFPATSPRFWVALMSACLLTVASVNLRALRWIFLLRRAETRIPIRDAYVGYLAGFALLLAPFFLGEMAIRAWVLRRRGAVPTEVTVFVNLWERWLDFLALASIAGVLWAAFGRLPSAAVCLGGVMLAASPAGRALCHRLLIVGAQRLGRFGGGGPAETVSAPALAQPGPWTTALATSVVAWLLPAAGYGFLVSGVTRLDAFHALLSFSSATLVAGLTLAPGGVVTVGGRLLSDLAAAGASPGTAALLVLAIRLATAGVATAFGCCFLYGHLRWRSSNSDDHFDAIADAYDVQIPEARRLALLAKKTSLMCEVLDAAGGGREGLDVGCGQGWYAARMRELGYHVSGIDTSAAQVARAAAHLRDSALVGVGSALSIPAADASYDFVYTINVLHHLPSIADQRHAFAELLRVLRPGGRLFVHEINTTNWLFRFYMGYVFPSLNCIDEGVERWLLPAQLNAYTEAPVVDVRYFTFLPDFLPEPFVRLCAPVERWLERSRFRKYSAHYMAVVRKPTT